MSSLATRTLIRLVIQKHAGQLVAICSPCLEGLSAGPLSAGAFLLYPPTRQSIWLKHKHPKRGAMHHLPQVNISEVHSATLRLH